MKTQWVLSFAGAVAVGCTTLKGTQLPETEVGGQEAAPAIAGGPAIPGGPALPVAALAAYRPVAGGPASPAQAVRGYRKMSWRYSFAANFTELVTRLKKTFPEPYGSVRSATAAFSGQRSEDGVFQTVWVAEGKPADEGGDQSPRAGPTDGTPGWVTVQVNEVPLDSGTLPKKWPAEGRFRKSDFPGRPTTGVTWIDRCEPVFAGVGYWMESSPWFYLSFAVDRSQAAATAELRTDLAKAWRVGDNGRVTVFSPTVERSGLETNIVVSQDGPGREALGGSRLAETNRDDRCYVTLYWRLTDFEQLTTACDAAGWSSHRSACMVREGFGHPTVPVATIGKVDPAALGSIPFAAVRGRFPLSWTYTFKGTFDDVVASLRNKDGFDVVSKTQPEAQFVGRRVRDRVSQSVTVKAARYGPARDMENGIASYFNSSDVPSRLWVVVTVSESPTETGPLPEKWLSQALLNLPGLPAWAGTGVDWIDRETPSVYRIDMVQSAWVHSQSLTYVIQRSANDVAKELELRLRSGWKRSDRSAFQLETGNEGRRASLTVTSLDAGIGAHAELRRYLANEAQVGTAVTVRTVLVDPEGVEELKRYSRTRPSNP